MTNSPLVDGADAVIEREIPVEHIIGLYKKKYGIDVTRYFTGIDAVKVMKCGATGYRFYYPLHLAGDGALYARLMEFDWYKIPWKWEYNACLDFIQPQQKVLEIGCGNGDFLKKIKELKGADCRGLELNENIKHPEGIQIQHVPIEEFSKKNQSAFDVVCSFQVMEHIPRVRDFLNAEIGCLKKGGLLIAGVPNNDAFIKRERNPALNMPPHHMGLWTEKSLRSLEKYFDIRLKNILYEPLQPYHYEWYVSLAASRYAGYYPSVIMGKLAFAAFRKIIIRILDKKAAGLKGHSVMAVFEKC